MTQRARNRYFVRAYATAGAAEQISIDFVCPWNCTLLQFCVNYGAMPDLTDAVRLRRISVDPRLDFTIRSFPVGTDFQQTIICNEPFEFAQGDHIQLIASNLGDLDIGAEIICAEAG